MSRQRFPHDTLPDAVFVRWITTIRQALAGLVDEEFAAGHAEDREKLLAAIHLRERGDGGVLYDAWILPNGEHAAFGDASGRAVSAWIDWYRRQP